MKGIVSMGKLRFKIFFFLLSFILTAGIYGQDAKLQKKINISLKEVSLPEALQELSLKTGASFSYNPDRIDSLKLITISAHDMSLQEILNRILPEMDLEYLVVEGKIVLKKSRNKSGQTQEVSEKRLFTLSGFMKDQSSGEVLIGGSVSLPGMPTGCTSNEYGFYSMQLPEGEYEILYSYLGYQPLIQTIVLQSDYRISVELKTKARDIEEVKIISTIEDEATAATQTSQSNLRAKSIRRMPEFMGETDVIKSLQTIPGIKFYGEGSTLFYVRGGNRDQNLILVDEAVLYNPSHLLGLFSSLSPGAINSVKVYKGDIPAEYGGRLSSLVDIKTREGNLKDIHLQANTGLFATSISAEGPIAKNKSSYFFSVRRSQLKWILRNSAPDLKDLYFSDLNFKFNFRLNDNNRIFFSTYAGKDKYLNQGNGNTNGIQWENVAGTLRWNHIFNERLFSNTSFTGSRYDYDFITSSERAEMWNSHISNFNLKSDFSFYQSPSSTLKFGVLLGNHYYNPGNFQSGINADPGLPRVSPRNTREQALYISSEQEINEKISLRIGFRFSGWANVGEAYEILYRNHVPFDTAYFPKGNTYNRFLIPEPRISFRFWLRKNSSFKTSFSHTSQFENLLSNSISPFTSLEVWLPASTNIKPQISDQFVISFQQNFENIHCSLTAEAFYKKMQNQIDYIDHAKMLFNPFIEAELRFGTTRSQGIELMFSKTAGPLQGWLAYTLSSTFMDFPDLNQGRPYRASYDRPNDLSIVMQYQIKPRWQISGNWIIMSGGRYSSPTGFYTYDNYLLPIYEEKNNAKLPVYHRLDVSSEFILSKESRKLEHILKFSLFNAYGHKNPFAINYNKIASDPNIYKNPTDHSSLPDPVFTMRYLFRVVPSFSYSISF
ncbi:MAG: TonB-dependent receptor [Bacteroidales bacterium]|nr:TonB-dependent receptor [Bacteroidales bacterium]MCB9013920.1 TonB-dependent receptor [Bacteroidales bacterium]